MWRRRGWDVEETRLGCGGDEVGTRRRRGWDAEETRLGRGGDEVGMWGTTLLKAASLTPRDHGESNLHQPWDPFGILEGLRVLGNSVEGEGRCFLRGSAAKQAICELD
jgi:hypothetical protein